MVAARIGTQARPVDNIDSRLDGQVSKEFTGGALRSKESGLMSGSLKGIGAAIAKKLARGATVPLGGNG